MGTTKDLCRELISLARQGGFAARDRRQLAAPKADGAAPAAAKGRGRSQPPKRKGDVAKGAASGSLAPGSRQGGGWTRVEGDGSALSAFKAKLAEVCEKAGGELDFREKPFFRTALWEATWTNHADIVKLLAAKGASISVADYQGRTPLHEAAYYGHLDLVNFLVDKGHPINCRDAFNQSPLFRAVEGGRTEVVRCLIERGAETNGIDADGVTVQHIAAFNGMRDLSEFLLSRGATQNHFAASKAIARDGLATTKRNSIGRETCSAKQGNPTSPLLMGGSLMVGEIRGNRNMLAR